MTTITGTTWEEDLKLPEDGIKVRRGGTVLHGIVVSKNLRSLIDTLEENKNNKNKIDINKLDSHGDGFSALHLAAKDRDGFDMVGILLLFGANVNIRNHHGTSPLMIAAGAGNEAIVQLLLQNGANSTLRDHSGFCAVTHCVLRPLTDAAHVLPKLVTKHTVGDLIKKFPQWGEDSRNGRNQQNLAKMLKKRNVDISVELLTLETTDDDDTKTTYLLLNQAREPSELVFSKSMVVVRLSKEENVAKNEQGVRNEAGEPPLPQEEESIIPMVLASTESTERFHLNLKSDIKVLRVQKNSQNIYEVDCDLDKKLKVEFKSRRFGMGLVDRLHEALAKIFIDRRTECSVQWQTRKLLSSEKYFITVNTDGRCSPYLYGYVVGEAPDNPTMENFKVVHKCIQKRQDSTDDISLMSKVLVKNDVSTLHSHRGHSVSNTKIELVEHLQKTTFNGMFGFSNIPGSLKCQKPEYRLKGKS